MSNSVLDIFKVGVGPSSSHTLGPWVAAGKFRTEIIEKNLRSHSNSIVVDLYGSLAHTGKGHGTDFAITMGLSGYDASDIDQATLSHELKQYGQRDHILINDVSIKFTAGNHINFWKGQYLPFHANGMTFRLIDSEERNKFSKTYYSIGGGFVLSEEEIKKPEDEDIATVTQSAKSIIDYHRSTNKSIVDIILESELQLCSYEEIRDRLLHVYDIMVQCAFDGCHTGGILPGGLNVERRAEEKHNRLMTPTGIKDPKLWVKKIREKTFNFRETIDWVSVFAIGVNEQNAAFGRVVTAPTNGAAGVIPAILLYIQGLLEIETSETDIVNYLLICGQIGQLYKQGATISAAAGGCQAEIGVSSSMAAGGLVYILGGSLEQIFMAAEIAMEHHLGLTCDPVNGLVQIPCIERNSIGAMKAITAAQLAMSSNPSKAKVSLDQVIKSMWETAQDMNEKYRETSLGGLAINVSLPEC